MYCKNCGEKVTREECYCNKCGTQLKVISSNEVMKKIVTKQTITKKGKVIYTLCIGVVLLIGLLFIWESNPNRTAIDVSKAYLKAIDTYDTDLFIKTMSKERYRAFRDTYKEKALEQLGSQLQVMNANLEKNHGEDWIKNVKYIDSEELKRNVKGGRGEDEQVIIQIQERKYIFLIDKQNGKYYVITVL